MPYFPPPSSSSGFPNLEDETVSITPSALIGNVNDYNPTGLVTARNIIVDGAGFTISGLVAQTAGRKVRIYNNNSSGLNLIISNNNINSLSTNQFLIRRSPAVNDSDFTDLIILPQLFADFIYSNIYNCWMLVNDGSGTEYSPIGLTLAFKNLWVLP